MPFAIESPNNLLTNKIMPGITPRNPPSAFIKSSIPVTTVAKPFYNPIKKSSSSNVL